MATVLTGPRGPSGDASYSTSSSSTVATGGVLEKKDPANVTVAEDGPALGAAHAERRFWFQRAKSYDPDAIATLVCPLIYFSLKLWLIQIVAKCI